MSQVISGGFRPQCRFGKAVVADVNSCRAHVLRVLYGERVLGMTETFESKQGPPYSKGT